MSKGKDPDVGDHLVLDVAKQMTFDFYEDSEYDLGVVGVTREGHTLFKRKEKHGGYSYWTDESPHGVCVFDEELSNPMSMFEALEDLGIAELIWRHVGYTFGYIQE